MLPRRRLAPFLPLVAAALAAACGGGGPLDPVSNANVIDTVQIYALRGTDIAQPSGYDATLRRVTRTDQGAFDFAFDFTDAGTPVFYPAGALGLTADAGLITVEESFAAVTLAPEQGYLLTAPIELAVDRVFVGRSRLSGVGCTLTSASPRYAKFHVLAVDPAARTITLEVLANLNCGYRGLEPGLPSA